MAPFLCLRLLLRFRFLSALLSLLPAHFTPDLLRFCLQGSSSEHSTSNAIHSNLESHTMSDTLKQFAELRRQAEQGNAEAQYKLGHMYEDGKGVPAYDAEAVKWYRLAAAQGAVEAQFRLGVIYASKGRAVPTDDAEAMTWWPRSAAWLHRHAQHNLGIMYTKGETSSGGLEAFFLYDGHSNFSQVNGVGAPRITCAPMLG